jgi:putative acetyltransferase
MLIREEAPCDLVSIRSLHRLVFKGDYEAQLVDSLRLGGLYLVSLIALDENEVLTGHILFSQLSVEIDGRNVMAAALAPLSVKPNRQRRGIGSNLIEDGLNELRLKSIEAVIVLGHPNFYSRFGFSSDLMHNLASPFRGKPEFMGLELVPGALTGESGRVKYPRAFGIKDS